MLGSLCHCCLGMKERNTRGAIVAFGLAVAVGLGVAGVFLTRAADTVPSPRVLGTTQISPVIDTATVYDPFTAGDPLPEGFRQLLARDQIEPVYDPQYTSQDQVDWPPDMLILGVEGPETAKAYPITHLNQHEMVLDDIDGLPILVSW